MLPRPLPRWGGGGLVVHPKRGATTPGGVPEASVGGGVRGGPAPARSFPQTHLNAINKGARSLMSSQL